MSISSTILFQYLRLITVEGIAEKAIQELDKFVKEEIGMPLCRLYRDIVDNCFDEFEKRPAVQAETKSSLPIYQETRRYRNERGSRRLAQHKLTLSRGKKRRRPGRRTHSTFTLC